MEFRDSNPNTHDCPSSRQRSPTMPACAEGFCAAPDETLAPAGVDGPLRRLLERMHHERLAARRDPFDTDRMILVRTTSRGSLGAGHAPRLLIEEGLRAGCLVRSRQGVITVAEGLDVTGQTPGSTTEPGPVPVTFNDMESPLLWLHRRKGPDGLPLLGELCFLAGERFRRDVTQAAMLPSVTTNWSRMESTSGRALPRDPAMASDATIAARQRVRAAFRVLGADMGHFVLDVCAFLEPLQQAEARRGWPARSAKLVLRMALDRLAQHYGLEVVATGPDRVRISSWQTDPQRVSMQAWLDQPGK